MKRVFFMLVAGTVVSGMAAYVATQRVEAKDMTIPVSAPR